MIISAIIDTRRENKEGKYPVKIRITERNKSAYISPNIYALPAEFDKSTGLFFTNDKKTRTKNVQYNSTILAVIERLNDIVLDYRKKNVSLSPEHLKNEFENISGQSKEITFNRHFRAFTDDKTGKTKAIYEMTLHKIEAFFGKNIEFEDITFAWLSTLEKKLKADNLKINSIAIHFRNIRAVYNNALANDLVGYEKYPFRKFKISHEKTRKRALAIEQLRTLFAYQGTPSENLAVDIAKMIFYLRGINIKDLFYLEESENGYVHYRRAKTGGLFSIRIEPETQILFDRYKGDNHLFCFREQMKLHESLTKKVNENLAEIAKKLHIPELTTYVFRHTWATIAAEMDIPKETIAAGLGHASHDVTDIYIKFNQRKVDEANRKIIDAVNAS